MADTPRTINELYALFADNTVGAISPQDLRDLVATLNAYYLRNDSDQTTTGSVVSNGGSDFNVFAVERLVNGKEIKLTHGIDSTENAVWNRIVDEVEQGRLELRADGVYFKTDVGAPAVNLTAGGGGVPSQLDADGAILDINTIADGRLVGRSGGTLVGANTAHKPNWFANQVVWDGVSDTLDLSSNPLSIVDLTNASAPTVTGGAAAGSVTEFSIEIVQDTTGYHSVAWPNNFEWAGSALDTSALGPDERRVVVGRTSDGGATYQVDHNGAGGTAVAAATQVDANGVTLDIGSIPDGLLVKRSGPALIGSDSLRKLFWQTGQQDWNGTADEIPLGSRTQIIATVSAPSAPTITGTLPFADLNVLEFTIELRMDDVTGHWPITWPAPFVWVDGAPPNTEDMGPGEKCFVYGRTSSGGASIEVVHSRSERISYQTQNYIIKPWNDGQTVRMASTDPRTVDVDLEGNMGAIPNGFLVAVRRWGPGPVTIGGINGANVNAVDDIYTIRAQYALAVLEYQGSDTWALSGDLG